MDFAWRKLLLLLFHLFFLAKNLTAAPDEEDYDGDAATAIPGVPAKTIKACNGIFLSYAFVNRKRLFPFVKNTTAQAWGFNATASVLNTGKTELESWKMFIKFQRKEHLVGINGAELEDGGDMPVDVSNGAYLSGGDLSTAIDTAGDLTQMLANVVLTGVFFGVKPPAVPLPKKIELVNDGYNCPGSTKKKSMLYVCCVVDKKKKAEKIIKKKFRATKAADLSIMYDVTQAYTNNYMAQVTIENNSTLGRLDHWNLTWEWTRGEFIYSMKGAYTHLIDITDCVYGKAAEQYGDMDFTKVLNCQKNPVISDLPKSFENDTEIGYVKYCCRNGSILPRIIDPDQYKSAFTVQVFKLTSENRTAIYPPQKWKIVGDVNPHYKCQAPVRITPSRFPSPRGLPSESVAIASWQIACNIERPKKKTTKCCVSFSAYYNESAIPCDTCACGCEDTTKCSENTKALLLPKDALLVPFANRTKKAIAWARMNHFKVPKRLPCGDNCGVSINWHLATDYSGGWSARMTIFNWEEHNFANWFAALQFKKTGLGFQRAYSFNGTFLRKLNHTIFLQGLEGGNYLVAETNGSQPRDPRIPGKLQSVLTFTKKNTPHVNIVEGDGFPSRVYFNGEECHIPTRIPESDGNRNRPRFVFVFLLSIVAFLLLETSLGFG